MLTVKWVSPTTGDGPENPTNNPLQVTEPLR